MAYLIRGFFFFIFSFSLTAVDIDFTAVEEQVWIAMDPYKEFIVTESEKGNIDPGLVFAILYVEKIQYELDAWLKIKKNMEETATSSILFPPDLYTWANLSSGFCNIKPSHSWETFQRAKKLGMSFELKEDQFQPPQYTYDPFIAIRILILSLQVFTEEWKKSDTDFDISGKPEILATLYNIGYEKSLPKLNPQSGGGHYPTILNGELIEDTSFGDRVRKIMEESRWLQDALDSQIQSVR